MNVLSARGFTLLEVLLAIVIMGILMGLTLPVTLLLSNRSDITTATQTAAGALRRAETYARGAKNDDIWSIHFQAGSAIIFKGTDFSGRNTDFDETVTIASTTVSGLTDLQFAKLSGMPNAAGSLTLTSTANTTETRTVTINAKGMVDY